MAETHPTTTDAPTQPANADILRAFLADQDVECPSCRYNVRGLRTDVCPECNQKLTLRLALAEPRMAGFVAGLVGLSMGLGVHAMLAGWFIVMQFRRFGGGPPLRDFVLLLALALVHAVLVWFWVRNRGRLTRASASARWSLVVACYLVSIGTFVIFVQVARP